MSSTKAGTGSGATLSIGTPGSGESFVSILQIKSLSWTNPKLLTEDATCLSSPTLGPATIKEMIPTVIEPGQMSGQAIYLPTDTGLAALNTAFASGVIHDFKLQFPPIPAFAQVTTGNLYTFSGYTIEQPLPDGVDATKLLTYKVTIQITTAISVTVGA
jgi:hypothetical protein